MRTPSNSTYLSARETLANAHKEAHQKMVIAALFAKTENWRQPKRTSAGDWLINRVKSMQEKNVQRFKG